MEVERLDEAKTFRERATPFLASSEARHNLILGISGTLVSRPEVYPAFRLWLVSDDGRVTCAALRTPPFDLVLSDGDPSSVSALAEAVAEESITWPGVVGNLPAVEVFVERWGEATRRTASVRMRQGVFEATAVNDVAPAGGESAPAGRDDRVLIADWFEAFEAEVFPDRSEEERAGSRARSEAALDSRLSADPDAGLWVYRVDGEPVSLAGFGGRTPNGVRVGPVYTPPRHRGRGYATELTARMTAHLLSRGLRFCFLYTDLANPTSNAIYERIGYRRVCVSTQYAFR
jgi:predicted GNAT family acetyltransferase